MKPGLSMKNKRFVISLQLTVTFPNMAKVRFWTKTTKYGILCLDSIVQMNKEEYHMKRFNAQRASASPAGKRGGNGKKAWIVAGAAAMILAAGQAVGVNTANLVTGGITAYAAEQTSNWFQDGNAWKVKDGSGNVVSNSWFCDLDDAWYLLDENGVMREGLINDGGHYYSLETSHTGHYGMMRTENGVYDGATLTFQQEHNGYYGEILSGVEDLIAAGAEVTTVSGLPAASVYAKDFGSSHADEGSSQASQSGPFTPEEIAELEEEIRNLSADDRELLRLELQYLLESTDLNLTPEERAEFEYVNAMLAKY